MADEHDGAGQGEHGRDDVGEDAQGQHDGGPAPSRPSAAPGEEPEEDEGQGEAERVGVLAGQGGEQVPP